MYRYFLVAILLYTTALHTLNAQLLGNNLIDSLEKVIVNTKEDTNKVILLSKLSFSYYNVNPFKGVAVGVNAADLAELLGWKKGKARAFNNIATNYNVQSDYLKALDYYLMALKIYEEINDTSGMANVLINIGINYLHRFDYKKAREYFFNGLSINKKSGNKKGMSTALLNIGTLYYEQKEYDTALQYFKESLAIDIEFDDKESIAISYNNIATIYSEIGVSLGALEYFEKSNKLFYEIGSKRGIAANLQGIGELYQRLYENNKTTAQLEIKNNENILLAEKNYKEALVLCESIGDIRSLSSIYEKLSQIQTLLGNTEKAFGYYKTFIIYKDSSSNQKNAEKIIQTQMKYEFEKAEIDARFKAEAEKNKAERKNYIQIAGIIAFVLFLTSVLLLLRKRKVKPLVLKLLGTFSLLVIFEFISLLLHPHITNLTHHNLIFTLLCLVLLASIIIPTHHKIEHWMHEKLVKHHYIEPIEDTENEELSSKKE